MKKHRTRRLAAAIIMFFVWSLLTPVLAISPSVKLRIAYPRDNASLLQEKVNVRAAFSGLTEDVTADLLVNGSLYERQRVTANAGEATVAFVWDTSALPRGQYHLAVMIQGESGREAEAGVTVNLTGRHRAIRAPSIKLPKEDAVVCGKIEVVIDANEADGNKIVLLVDGNLKAITNVAPYRITLNTDGLREGVHALQAQVYGPNREVVSSKIATIQVVREKARYVGQPLGRGAPVLSRVQAGGLKTVSPRGERLRVVQDGMAPRRSNQFVTLIEPEKLSPEASSYAAEGGVAPAQAGWEMALTTGKAGDDTGPVDSVPALPDKPPASSAAEKEYCTLPAEMRESGDVLGARLSGSVVSSPGAAQEEAPAVEAPAAQSPAPALAETPKTFLYEVQEGDCLWEIARAYDTTVAAIVEANDIADPTLIKIGQEIWVPTTPTLTVKGRELTVHPGPFFRDGELMVPLRAIVEACGGRISWDEQTSQVSFDLSGKRVVFETGATKVLVDGRSVELGTPSVLKEGRTFISFASFREIAALPARFELEENQIEIARLPL